MTQQILFIHGAGGYDSDQKLANSLQDNLGSDYALIYPKMPNEDNPEHDAWKDQILTELTALKGSVILVAHSLGASTLLKVLSEETIGHHIVGLFLIATPYWDAKDADVKQYALRDDFAAHLPADLPMFLYHSRGDEWVPFEHLALYAEKLPQAIIREFDGRGHQFNDDLSEVVADIAHLTDQSSL